MRVLMPMMVIGLLCAGVAWASDIDADEQVLFFPTSAALSEDGDVWIVPIHGWIFEQEEDSLWRWGLMEVLEEEVAEPRDDAEEARFTRRGRRFLVDNEGGQRVEVRVGGETFELAPSAPNGHFHGSVRVLRDAVHAADGWLVYEAVTRPWDERTFQGEVQLLEPRGVSVISDIDDTIKVSEVAHRQRLLRRTFLEPYEAVPGMAAIYRRWAEQGAAFHYITATPWQLHEPVATWMRDAGFPRGSFHMKLFRWRDETIANLFIDAEVVKAAAVAELLERYPGRRFILVGDDGEDDPELYARLAREHPDQVEHIFIRHTGAHEPGRTWPPLEALPADRWTVFSDDDLRVLSSYELPPPVREGHSAPPPARSE
ncbi:MAG: phosphatase domain-containing protein [Phycisphaeraceae bacterium]